MPVTLNMVVMKRSLVKTEQLQIRVSAHEKKCIQQAAKRANMNMSDWVLKKVLPDQQARFQTLVALLNDSENRRFALASLNDLFTAATANEFSLLVTEPSRLKLDALNANYLAAMIELAATKKKVESPRWILAIKPLESPYFSVDLKSLRIHLLTHSPAPFRKRNIFIDSTLGDRV